MPDLKKVALFTNEYPPNVYGGAGVHVEYLSRELARLVPVEVRCFGDQDVDAARPARQRLRPLGGGEAEHGPALHGRARRLPPQPRDGQRQARRRRRPLPHLVHGHGGLPRQEAVGRPARPDHPLARAAAALEGRAARQRATTSSAWMERTAHRERRRRHRRVAGDARDVLRTFEVDARARPRHPQRDRPRRVPARSAPLDALVRTGSIPTRPYRALRRADHAAEGHHPPGRRDPARSTPRSRSCCAPARPTPARSATRWRQRVAEVSRTAPDVIWIQEMLPRADVIQLYSHAAVFCCPSVYEPFGIINLEAMACETAVVASAVGGHPGGGRRRTRPACSSHWRSSPALRSGRPGRYSADLAAAINRVALDPALRETLRETGGGRSRSASAGRRSRAHAGPV